MTARVEDLNDDGLGRTLDWLYEHDVTRLFAGLALRARRAFGVTVERLHADTTSFSVHGQYARPLASTLAPATGQAVPDQVRKPTARLTMRWLFQCFEGIDLHYTHLPEGTWASEVLRLSDVHRLILRLLGAAYENCYLLTQQTAE